MKKKYIYLACIFLLFISDRVFSQETNTSTAPRNTSKSSETDVAQLTNSVNLLNGEVNLPVNVVDLPGRNGLGINLSIVYSSTGISKKVNTWNAEAPTGILGLGWSLEFPKIVCDNKQTGTRDDDEFFLSEGGSMVALKRIDDNPKYLGCKMYQVTVGRDLIIKYIPSSERWEIIRDGLTYVYGDINKNAIQWVVKWGNWIGNSARTHDNNGIFAQQQQAYIWNLSEIGNQWGDKVFYEYLNINQHVGEGGLEHTEASYVSKVTDMYGRTVTLSYLDKDEDEYQEPHIETGAEPDAYQEVYEKKYLSNIEVKNEFGKRLSLVEFGYSKINISSAFQGSGEGLNKRFLNSIDVKNNNDAVVASTIFSHNGEANNNFGKIEMVTYPSGKTVRYLYNSGINIGHFKTTITASSPGSNWGEPKVYSEKGYTVVVWRESGGWSNHYNEAKKVRVKVYSWEGEWLEQDLGEFPSVWKNDSNEWKNFYCSTSENFFAIMTLNSGNYSTGEANYRLGLFHKDKSKRGTWVRTERFFNLATLKKYPVASPPYLLGFVRGEIEDEPTLLATPQLISVNAKKRNGDIHTFVFTGTGWMEQTFFAGGGSERYHLARNNYIISHNEEGWNDPIRFYYLDELKSWQWKDWPESIRFESREKSYWHGSNSSALVMAANNPEFIYHWDENYNPTRSDVLGAYPDDKPVYTSNSMIAIRGKESAAAARFDGVSWVSTGNQTSDIDIPVTFAYAEDAMIWPNGLYLGAKKVWANEFNPNSLRWEVNNNLGLYGNYNIHMGLDHFYLSTNYYRRNPNGEWVFLSDIPIPIQETWSSGYPDLSAFKYATQSKSFWLYLRNGRVKSAEVSGSSNTLEAGYETIIRYDDYSSYDAKTVYLTRVVREDEGGAVGGVKFCPVAGVSEYNGSTTRHVSFHYIPETAVTDPSASVAIFNGVWVIPGVEPNVENTVSSKPYGFTVNLFFNGLDKNQVAAYSSEKIGDRFYPQLTGQLYRTVNFDAAGNQVSSNDITFDVRVKAMIVAGKVQCLKHLAFPVKTVSVLDGVTSTEENTYNDLGLLAESKTSYYNWKGELDELKSQTQYAYEIYPELKDFDMLTLPSQVKKLVNNEVISSEVTTFKDYGSGHWAAHKNYAWRRTGTSDFDFSSWSGSDEPVSDWKRSSVIIARDDKGNVLSTQGADGISVSTIYGHKKSLPVLQAWDAEHSSLISEDFDDMDLSDNEPHGILISSGNWSINNVGVLTVAQNTNLSTLGINQSISQDEFAADFSLRVSGSTTGDWVGFQFNKTAGNHGVWDSGHSLIVRKNDRIEFLSNGNLIKAATLYTKGWHNYKVVKKQAKVNIYVDGTLVMADVPCSGSGTYVGFTASNCFGEFDNLRVCPLNARISSTAYDRDYRRIKSTTDNNGNTTRTLFANDGGTAVASLNTKGTPMSTLAGSSSMDRNEGVLSASDPNLILSTKIMGTGFYEDFETTERAWQVNDRSMGSSWVLENGRLRLQNNNGGTNPNQVTSSSYLLDFNSTYTGRIGIEVEVTNKSSNPQWNFGIGLGTAEWDGSPSATGSAIFTAFLGGDWKYYSTSKWTQINNYTLKRNKTYRLKIVADLTDANQPKADYYIDGKLLIAGASFRSAGSFQNLRRLALFDYAQGGGIDWEIDNIVVYTDPIHLSTYTDANGNIIQTQTEEPDNKVMVTETIYDALGRPHIQTIPTRINGGFGYQENFFTTLDGNGLMSGTVSTINPEYGNYPYSQTVFESSPIGRVIEKSKPGVDFKIGSGHTLRVNYGDNTSFNIGSYPDHQYYVAETINEDGHKAYAVRDLGGNVIKTLTGKVTDGTYESINTYEYDKYGNLVKEYLPNYHSQNSSGVAGEIILDQPNTSGNYIATNMIVLGPGFSTDGDFSASINVGHLQVKTMIYNLDGELVQATSPDKGMTRILYDDQGHSRFMQDANGVRNNQIIYTIYDRLGRTVEEGYLTNHKWDDGVLRSYILNSPNSTIGYPERVWRKRFFYESYRDYNPWSQEYSSTLNSYDRLVTVEINNDVDDLADVKEGYSYDRLGNVNSKVTNINDSFTEGVGYLYDDGGRLKTTSYSRNVFIDSQGLKDLTTEYDIAGRPRTIRAGTKIFASYSFNKNGALESEKLAGGNITRSFSYAPAGLTKIEDPFFKEEISYTSGNAYGGGYYSGLISQIQTSYKYPNSPVPFTVKYGYDEQARLVIADNTLSSYDLGISGGGVRYDANGNIVYFNQNNIPRVYQYLPGTNRLGSINGSSSGQLTYDDNGNVLRSDTKGLALTYDSYFNQVSSISKSSTGTLTEFMYDAENERTVKNVKYNNTNHYTYYIRGVADYPLMELRSDGSVIAYIYGATGLIAMRNLNTGETDYPMSDHLGSTRVLVRESTLSVTAQYDYQPFGSVMRSTNPQDFSYRYTGQEYDDETLLNNYRARLYDSDLGVFYAADPEEQFAASYSYAANNPVMNTDPDGRIVPIVVGAVIKAAFVGAAIAGTGYVVAVGVSKGGFDNFDPGQFKKAIFGGFISGGLAYGIGAAFGATGSVGREIARASVHGIANGLSSELTGGDFGSGFLSSAIGSLGSSGFGAVAGDIVSKGIGTMGFGAISGGIGAELSGGDFWRGAVSGVIVAALNHLQHQGDDAYEKQQAAARRYKNEMLLPFNEALLHAYMTYLSLADLAKMPFVSFTKWWAARQVGAVLRTVDDVMANPILLKGKSYQSVRKLLSKSEGWVNSVMTKTRGSDKGWVLRQVNSKGQETGKLIQYHPGSRRHFGGAPYWKVSDGAITFRFRAN